MANASLFFPAYKKINFTLSSTDNYLGDPPAGYQRNTFQFTAGITYVVSSDSLPRISRAERIAA